MSEVKSTNGESSEGVVSTSTPTGGAREAQPTRDDVFEALSNRRRRYALHHLKQLDTEGPVDLSEVSTQVAAWELGTDPASLTYDDRKNVHTSLYQFHAPKMDDLGLVRYDRRSGTVELTEYGRELDVYLELVTGRQIPWSVYFLLLSFGGVVLVALVWLDVYPFTAVPDVDWAVFLSMTFFASSSVFTYHSRFSMRVGNDGPPPEVED